MKTAASQFKIIRRNIFATYHTQQLWFGGNDSDHLNSFIKLWTTIPPLSFPKPARTLFSLSPTPPIYQWKEQLILNKQWVATPSRKNQLGILHRSKTVSCIRALVKWHKCSTQLMSITRLDSPCSFFLLYPFKTQYACPLQSSKSL